ncbi:recombinase family protein (plasmid) [Nocardia sp. CA-151230]|uniref:recombinase family protein n=1 Tax=Nocardia sp. CA-151230 TaxID=3239982 RepID=UPI003D8D4EC0
MSARARRSPVAILRAIIYARVSKDDSARGRSCEEQIEECTRDCVEEGWEIAEILADNDRGASRHSRRERENWKRLPRLLQSGDVLVVWEPSRLTRDMKAFGDFCDMCARIGVRLYYDGRIWDLNDDDDRNRVWQDILDGAKQVGKTRKRVLRAMEANAKANKAHGRIAPGYMLVRDPETGKVVKRVPHPVRGPIIAEAARRVLNHESRRSVAKDLAPRWKAAGGSGQFGINDVTRYLRSPTTYGMRGNYGEIRGRGDWEPLVDPELYRQILAVLDAGPTWRSTEPRYLLSYLAKCGLCLEQGLPGDVKRMRSARGDDRYQCADFGHVSRTIQRTDSHVEEVLLRLLENPETAAQLVADDNEPGYSVDAELAAIEQMRADIAAFIKGAAKTRMSADAVAAYVEEVESQIREAEKRVGSASGDPVLDEFMGPNARELWAAADMNKKRYVLRHTVLVVINRLIGGPGFRDGSIGVTVRPLKFGGAHRS